jgi:hypothetical protein
VVELKGTVRGLESRESWWRPVRQQERDPRRALGRSRPTPEEEEESADAKKGEPTMKDAIDEKLGYNKAKK